MNRTTALQFVERHGIVLESTHGPVVTFADAAAGERIRGNWWSHPKSHQIFALTRLVRNSPDVLVCRLVDGKITYVHRRVWPALVRLAGELRHDRLAEIHEVHTPLGKHVVKVQAGCPSQFNVRPLVSATLKRVSSWALGGKRVTEASVESAEQCSRSHRSRSCGLGFAEAPPKRL